MGDQKDDGIHGCLFVSFFLENTGRDVSPRLRMGVGGNAFSDIVQQGCPEQKLTTR